MKLLFDENLSPKLPRLVWLRIGNCTRADLLSLLTTHETDIRAFEADPNASVLVLS
jgi:predicted nuclease of predicted toxin-antitoxin system